MAKRINNIHRLVFIVAVLTAAIFIFAHTTGQSNNIEFKNADLRKLCFGVLNLALIISFLFSSVFLWQLIEDSFYTKAVLIAPVILIGFWAITVTFSSFFEKPWETTRITRIDNDPPYTHQAEQEKKVIFFHDKLTRTVRVKSFLGIFWKVKVVAD